MTFLEIFLFPQTNFFEHTAFQQWPLQDSYTSSTSHLHLMSAPCCLWTRLYVSWGRMSTVINISLQHQVQSTLIVIQGWADSLYRIMNSLTGWFQDYFSVCKNQFVCKRAPKWPDEEHTAPPFTPALLWRTFLQLTLNRQFSDKNYGYPDHERILFASTVCLTDVSKSQSATLTHGHRTSAVRNHAALSLMFATMVCA